MKTSYSVIGGMAGSSMDGFDLALVSFQEYQNSWSYEIKKCQTISYDSELHPKLKNSALLNDKEQHDLDFEFGAWISTKVIDFAQAERVDLLGIHGHTVIHKPESQISWQLGKGEVIAKNTQIPTVTDFRTEDIISGGQGAPLVPFGDFTLFKEYDACLNLGGIANISIKADQTAWDICPCNQVLNFFAEKLHVPFDENGEMARSGTLDIDFYDEISSNSYFKRTPPKSLPNNFIDISVLNRTTAASGLHTYCKVIAEQVKHAVSHLNPGKLLITGGGALNGYLVELISNELEDWEIIVPTPTLINFKESLIFAFLALKRKRGEVNTLATVTGATNDTSSGVIHFPE